MLTFSLGLFAQSLFQPRQAQTTYCLIKAVEPVESSSFQSENTQDVENDKPDTFQEGWYLVDNFKGMKEVWTILLSRDYEDSTNQKVGWSAMILTQHADFSPNDDDDFQSVWIKTENNRLSFRTNKIRGIEYKFDGTFFKNGKEFSDGEKVLKGTLRKIVKGKEVAKFTADFAYAEPHCLH